MHQEYDNFRGGWAQIDDDGYEIGFIKDLNAPQHKQKKIWYRGNSWCVYLVGCNWRYYNDSSHAAIAHHYSGSNVFHL